MAEKQTKGTLPKKEGAGPTTVTVKKSAGPPARVQAPGRLWPLMAWEREIDRFFDDFRRRFAWPRLLGPEHWPTLEMDVRVPTMDVFEKDDEVVVKAEIPGMSKDDIEVNLTDSTLTVKGEKKKEEEVKEEDYYRCERSFGSFSRTVELPVGVKTDQAKATFKDGVLEVRLPKTEETKRKAVKVEVKET